MAVHNMAVFQDPNLTKYINHLIIADFSRL